MLSGFLTSGSHDDDVVYLAPLVTATCRLKLTQCMATTALGPHTTFFSLPFKERRGVGLETHGPRRTGLLLALALSLSLSLSLSLASRVMKHVRSSPG